jgi:hypothetical protein
VHLSVPSSLIYFCTPVDCLLILFPNIWKIICYSLRPILLFTNTDVSITKMCLDTSILAKSIMGRREYQYTRNYFNLGSVHSYMIMNIADWIAALGCLFAVKGLLQASNSSKKWMWYSFYVSVAISVFWTYYLLKYVILQTTQLSLLCQTISYHIISYHIRLMLL